MSRTMLSLFTVVLFVLWSKTGSVSEEITVDLPGGAKMEFVWIEPGTFVMGLSEDQRQLMRDTWDFTKEDWESGVFEDQSPTRQVTISRGFYMGKCELTQGQWSAVMGTQPWGGDDYARINLDNPAVDVSYRDVATFVHRLNEATGDSLYRLPSEAEWEYACRAGTTTLWSFGDAEPVKDFETRARVV